MIPKRVVVTGGFGFIGSALVRSLSGAGCHVLNIDAMTYAASPSRVSTVSGVEHLHLDIRDESLAARLADFSPDVVVHTAAETHVTRSEVDPAVFFSVNVDGTRNLIEATRTAGALLVHISTDEVYGPSSGHAFGENDKRPGEGAATSAYARSKALADDAVLAASGDQPVIVIRPTNCFGPWQHPEKAIPRWITRALLELDLPVWGDGRHVRDWMFVEDAAQGIATIIERAQPGEVFNLGPGASSVTNLEIARAIAHLSGLAEDSVYLTKYDRPQHDRMYRVDTSRVRSLGWKGGRDFHLALGETVEWFRRNEGWWRPLIHQSESLYEDGEGREP